MKKVIEVFEEAEECIVQPEDIELEAEDAIVQVVDGVLIGGDDEEVKMMFYYIKPGGNALEDDRIQCRGVAEFRTSKAKFLEIAKYINFKEKELGRYQRKLDDYMFV